MKSCARILGFDVIIILLCIASEFPLSEDAFTMLIYLRSLLFVLILYINKILEHCCLWLIESLLKNECAFLNLWKWNWVLYDKELDIIS